MLFSRLESSANLKHHLPEMGMRDLFDIGRADLSGMGPNNNVFVSDVFHKAFIGNGFISVYTFVSISISHKN